MALLVEAHSELDGLDLRIALAPMSVEKAGAEIAADGRISRNFAGCKLSDQVADFVVKLAGIPRRAFRRGC